MLRADSSPASSSLVGWWLGWILFVVYGSLVPLQYRDVALGEAVARLLAAPMLNLGVEGRADWVANGVLYLPVGFLTAMLLIRSSVTAPARGFAACMAVAFGMSLAVAVEFAQVFFPPRTVSRNDLLAEGVGTLFGALLAWRVAPELQRLLYSLGAGWPALASRAAALYATGLVVLSLFPYDLLVSVSELQARWRSAGWGWWVAPSFATADAMRLGARIAAEALVVVPLGWLWARERAAVRGLTLLQAGWRGVLLGFSIELAQWFIASGVSQGISVLTRAVGAALGAWLWARGRAWTIGSVRQALSPTAWVLAVLYMPVVLALSGWWTGTWRSAALAWSRLQGDEIRLVPFYYHYFTTETVALYSLLSVALLWAPLGLLLWARALSPNRAAGWGALLATGVEMGKLFPAGARPDPTNVLVVTASIALSVWLLNWLARPATGATVEEADTGATRPAAAGSVTSPLRWIALVGVALAGTVWLLTYPWQPALIAALLLAGAALTWLRPVWVFGLVFAALPGLDFSVWSGRWALDEFDALLLVCVSMAYMRLPPGAATAPRRADAALAIVCLLVALALAAGVARALTPWPDVGVVEFGNAVSPFNALRLAKGALWAWVLYRLAGRFEDHGQPVWIALIKGLALGAVGVAAVVIWERLVFVDLFDMSQPYRVSGPFTEMRTGGAYIEGFLVVALPAQWLWLQRVQRASHALCVTAMLGVTIYALGVTFSRGGYLGAALALLILFAGLWTKRRSLLLGRQVMPLLLVLTVAVPVLGGSFALSRWSAVDQDGKARLAHWSSVLSAMDTDESTTWFGMGLGRFPAVNHWRRVADDPMAVPSYVRAGGDGWLSLGAGRSLYVDQSVDVLPSTNYRVELEARSAGPAGAVSLSLCHKWHVASFNCKSVGFDLKSAEPKRPWQKLDAELHSPPEPSTGVLWRWPVRPVRLSIQNDGGSRVEVTQIRLLGPGGVNVLHNGDFAAGQDRWTFTSDDHLAWHVKSLPLATYFELGLLGVVAFAALLLLVVVRVVVAGRRPDTDTGLALAAGLIGFMAVGLFDTLIDVPRFLFLFLFVAFAAARSLNPTAMTGPRV